MFSGTNPHWRSSKSSSPQSKSYLDDDLGLLRTFELKFRFAGTFAIADADIGEQVRLFIPRFLKLAIN